MLGVQAILEYQDFYIIFSEIWDWLAYQMQQISKNLLRFLLLLLMYGFGYFLQWIFIYFESDFDLIRYFNFIYSILKKSDFNSYLQTYKNKYIYSPPGVLDQIESLEPKLQLIDVLFQKNQKKINYANG